MGIVSTGIRRRARLLGEALRPPRPTTLAGGVPAQTREEPAPATRPAKSTDTGKISKERKDRKAAAVAGAGGAESGTARRPEKRTVAVTYTVPTASRLVESPVFVLAPVRSGSTLLRMLLNSHSRIRAPHELHLRAIDVRLTPGFSDRSMKQLDLDQAELEHVLWDRVLNLELERSGKDVIVDKTPGNVWTWERLRYAWPKARFLILLRHPAAIVSSLVHRQSNTATWRQLEANVLKYLEPLEEARQTLQCPTVRYEELTAEPERVTRELCEHLGVDWEPGMLDYGTQDHGAFLPNLGDRSGKIRSGQIQPAGEPEGAERLSPRLREIADAWGYR
ncbi:sulfotransferase family protein [Streptomyces sp. 4N509B]|uniref:sulfotransferase family protein n=1 Tax=Streptomyces sp. 4N509B TaxID=3457413 RepID=UPI003FD3A4DB